MKNKQIFIYIAIFGLLVAGCVWFWQHRSGVSETSRNTNSSSDLSALEGQMGTGSVTPTPSPSLPRIDQSNLKLSYGQALAKFPYRIQINQCHLSAYLATTGFLNVAKGSQILLDNRDNQTHTLKIFGSSYILGPYGFKVYSANTKGKYNITCDNYGSFNLTVE